MTETAAPPARIIFVPGKNPKPQPELYRAQHWRCLLHGVRNADPVVCAEMEKTPELFDVVPWNYSYYGSYRDIAQDLPWIDALLKKNEATPADRRAARSFRQRLALLSLLVADTFPSLIRHITDERIRTTIVETMRYFENRDGIAEIVRAPLLKSVREACDGHAPILLIGHSLGSVIAWDTLWLLSHEEPTPCKIDLFLTLGSPLGTRYVQDRLLSHGTEGRSRYPTNLRRWLNVTAVGDLIAYDPTVRNDFREMLRLDLIHEIRDLKRPYNWYETPDGLNFHRSYGYFANPAVGKVIAEWWRQQVAPPAH